MKRSLAISLCLLGIAAGSVIAQPVPEQSYLLTSTTGLYTVDRSSKQLTTLSTLGAMVGFSDVTMNTGNVAATFLFNDIGVQRVMVYSPLQGVTTLIRDLKAQGRIDAMAVDQDGRLLIGGGLDNALYKTVGLLNNSATTLRANVSRNGVSAVCIDDDNGDYVVATHGLSGQGLVLRVDGRKHTVTTIASGLSNLTGIEHDQATGNYVLTAGVNPHVQVIDRTGRRLTTQNIGSASGLWLDDATGLVHVATKDSVVVLDRFLRVVERFGPYPVTFEGIALWGSRKIGPASSIIHSGGKRGSKYAVQGMFHDSPNKSYACGISLAGLRPGIPVGNRTINIVPDALFFATIEGRVPLFTTKFVGSTDSKGRFSASFIVPPISVVTGTVYFVAAVVNPTKPSNLDLGKALTIRVTP